MRAGNEYDSIIANCKWKFDEAVSNCFDNMLERSIPGYDRMRSLVFSFGKRFVKQETYIIDIGCSLGNAISPFIAEFADKCKFLGIENSTAMVHNFNERFHQEISNGYVEIVNCGVEDYYPQVNASLVLSVLTLQFVSLNNRQGIVNSIYNSLCSNGAFILVEKTKKTSLKMADLFKDVYYELKMNNGYTKEQIFNKEKSLEGVLEPLTYEDNIQMLKNAGFKHIHQIWSDIMFVAWIAVKE